MEKIIEIATLHFSRYGTQSVSMSDIASYCGISKKTIYVYFESKEILIKQMVQLLLAENMETLDSIQNSSLTPLEEMESLFDNIHRTIKILTPILTSEIKQHYPGTYRLFLQFQKNKVQPFVIQNIQRGVQENIYRNDLDCKTVSLVYCWQLQNIYESTLAPMSADELLDQTNKLFLQGILRSLSHCEKKSRR